MTPLHHHKETLAPIGKLNLLLDKTNAQAIAKALQGTSLELPESGDYFVDLVGSTLHVYEMNQGITRYQVKARDEQKSVEIVPDGVKIELSGARVSEVHLHTGRFTPTQPTLLLEELSAPMNLLKEYAKLQTKSTPSTEDLHRKRELIKEIGKEFIKAKEANERTSSRTQRSSYLTRTSESHSGGSYRAG